MQAFAVFLEGFEHLSYPLGKEDTPQEFESRKEAFFLVKVGSELEAQSFVAACDAIQKHASVPVGYLFKGGEFFLVCKQRKSARKQQTFITPEEKRQLAEKIILRLAEIHSEGLCCGGISPEAIEYAEKKVFLSDPSRLSASTEANEMFFEVISTLCLLKKHKLASEKDFGRLASIYLSFSPICRDAVYSYSIQKSKKGSLKEIIVRCAAKYSSYF
ncbi:MAG: hypothetical protein N3G80_00130 [Candidatus Micrarchaeota archaeon]|nr:hypothetical protein [Candidatus Micrarchaeota archaeon]